MRKFVLYVAISADGYLARRDDDVSWLDAFHGDYGMPAFFDSIDTVILGRRTWEVGRRLGMEAYEGKTNYVVSRAPVDSDKVVHATDAVALVRELRQREGKDVWLCGGAAVFGSLLDAGEVDEIILHVMPAVIGEGIPLFAPRHRNVPLELLASERYDDGVVRLHYRVLVMTPAGPRRRERVHYVRRGEIIRHVEDRIEIVGADGAVRLHIAPAAFVAPTAGWITSAIWDNTSADPVTSFTATWTVPPAPASAEAQLIYLFNGFESTGDAAAILQPVLQWGTSEAGGGAFWSAVTWYVSAQGDAFYSDLVPVTSGDALTGVIGLTIASGARTYTAAFSGIAGTQLTVTNAADLFRSCVALEAYGISTCSGYPDTAATRFSSVTLIAGSSSPAVSWSARDRVTNCGQHTTVQTNGATNAIIDLCYR